MMIRSGRLGFGFTPSAIVFSTALVAILVGHPARADDPFEPVRQRIAKATRGS